LEFTSHVYYVENNFPQISMNYLKDIKFNRMVFNKKLTDPIAGEHLSFKELEILVPNVSLNYQIKNLISTSSIKRLTIKLS